VSGTPCPGAAATKTQSQPLCETKSWYVDNFRAAPNDAETIMGYCKHPFLTGL